MSRRQAIRPDDCDRNRRWDRRRFLHWTVALPGLMLAGCAESAAVTILTDWPRGLCASLERALARAEGQPPSIHWKRVAAGQLDTFGPDLRQPRAWGCDLVLSLAPVLRGRPEALFPHAEVGIAHREDIFESRAMEAPSGWAVLTDPRLVDLIALGDPRIDPVTLALARARMYDPDASDGSWLAGYSDLVRAAGLARPIGRTAAAPAAELAAGNVALAPALADDLPPVRGLDFEPRGPGPRSSLVMIPGGPREPQARQLRDRLASLELLAPADDPAVPTAAPGVSLLAELLGATLVDAQYELQSALRTLLGVELGPGSQLATFLTQPPPWPPASVQVLQRSSEQAPLIAALAEELAPDDDRRRLLLAEWSRSPAPIDPEILTRLEALDSSRLRGWLRAEWTAWAQQRYRRVARQARHDASIPSDGADRP